MFPTKPPANKFAQPLTFLLCFNCKTENSRPFKEGDYVFLEIEEKCPKCGSNKMLVTGIYVKEKQEKKKEV
ncbi:MAG: hypothetical protein QXL40_00965 [Nitrososphaerota archaeon]